MSKRRPMTEAERERNRERQKVYREKRRQAEASNPEREQERLAKRRAYDKQRRANYTAEDRAKRAADERKRRLLKPELFRAVRARYNRKHPGAHAEQQRAYYARIMGRAGVGRGIRANGEEVRYRALRSDYVFFRVDQATPRGLPKFIRDDVMSELVLLVLGGDITLEDVPKHVRSTLTKVRADEWSTVSLDAPLRGAPDRTLHDRLTTEIEDYDEEEAA